MSHLAVILLFITKEGDEWRRFKSVSSQEVSPSFVSSGNLQILWENRLWCVLFFKARIRGHWAQTQKGDCDECSWWAPRRVQRHWELYCENLWIPGWGHCLWELTEVWLVSCWIFFSLLPLSFKAASTDFTPWPNPLDSPLLLSNEARSSFHFGRGRSSTAAEFGLRSTGSRPVQLKYC